MRTYTVAADGQLKNAAAYNRLVVTYDNGAPIHLRDIGHALDSTDVVLENSVRYRERGELALRTALVGRREIGFTVLSMTLSRVAIFIPIVFLGGIIGRLFREFALPLAMVGALLALLLFGQELNIFSFVGLIMLVGLVKKNGIIMVDFAVQQQREHGLEPAAAILEACLVRFRPIMMTTLAAIFGALPIAVGFGLGAEARRPLGIATVGGLVLSQLLTLYITPAFFVAMARLTGKLRRRQPVVRPVLAWAPPDQPPRRYRTGSAAAD